LYAAYGSKAELFERAMHRYASENALPVAKLLTLDRPPAEALSSPLPSNMEETALCVGA